MLTNCYYFCQHSVEGYFNVCCCIKAGTFGEENCPDFCLFMEGCVCNCVAVSASRQFVMEKYDLSSDECDYRLIRINNFLQMLACVCSILAIFISELREASRLEYILSFLRFIPYDVYISILSIKSHYQTESSLWLRTASITWFLVAWRLR